MKGLGYGKGYQYAHDLETKVADMQCLPDNLRDRVYYKPTNEGIEKRIRERMEEIKRQRSRTGDSRPSAAKERILALSGILHPIIASYGVVSATAAVPRNILWLRVLA